MVQYQFTCSRCGQRIAVNEPMRTTLLSEGCVSCDAPVTPSDFSGA